MNLHLLVSSARYLSTDQPINPYYSADSSVDTVKAVAEHQLLIDTLEAIGVKVTQVSAPSDSQDGVYVANWALVRGNKAVLARLPSARKSEESHARNILKKLGKTIIELPKSVQRFSGQGDALACGNYLFCGQGYRSDSEAQSFAANALGFTLIQFQAVPLLGPNGVPLINVASGWQDSLFYDIDIALSIIREPSVNQKGIIAVCKKAFDETSIKKLESLEDIEIIDVDYEEAVSGFACNLVSTEKGIVISALAPKLQADLQDKGFNIHAIAMPEIAKGGGFIRCSTLQLD